MAETDWESRYRAGDTPWEKGEASPPLLDWLTRNAMPGEVLVPGCGSGHDVRAIAAAGASVTGLDIAASAVARASGFPPVGGERFIEGDLLALPATWSGRFDWVFEHTCFCAIDPSLRQAYVRAVAGALKPGGKLLAVFYMDPDVTRGEGPPFGVGEEELSDLFGPYFELLCDEAPTRAYPGREGRERVRVLEKTSDQPAR